MFKPKKYSILPVFILFSPYFLFSQINLQDVKSTLEFREGQIEYLSLDSAREERVTRAWYFNSSYLRINEELNYQINLLSSLNFAEQSSQDKGSNNKLIQEYITSKANSKASITELNQLAKLGKFNNPDLENPFELAGDRNLRDYHHRLLKIYMEQNGFQKQGQEHFRSIFRDLIGEIEQEVKNRGFFPMSKDGIPEFTEKYAERFRNIEILNRAATLEAKHFVDGSPLFLESRKEALTALENIRQIDESFGIKEDKLPKLRDLLTDATVTERIATFEIGLDHAEKQTKLKRYYDTNAKVLSKKISAALAAEIQWFYLNQKHEVILKGNSKRGPPDIPPPTIDIHSDPLPPKKPSGGSGGITLDDFVSSKDLEKIDKKTQRSFNKVFEFEIERFKAYNLNNPSWNNVKNSFIRTNLPYSGTIIDFNSHIKGLVTEYYRNMPLDPVKSTIIDAEIRQTLNFYSKGPKLSRTSFLGNDLVTISLIEENLKAGIRAREIEITTNKLSPPWRKKEIDVLNKGLIEIREAKLNAIKNLSDPKLNQVKAYGDLFDRPPPEVSNWLSSNKPNVEDLDNEKFALQVEQAKRNSLEKLRAVFGDDFPPSAKQNLAKIKQTQTVNEATKILATYQDYAPYASKLKPIEFAVSQPGFESSEKMKFVLTIFENDFVDIKAKENALHIRLDRLFKDLQNPELRSNIPSELYDRAAKAKKSLPSDVKITGVNPEIENWRPNQDFEKLKNMKFSKDPGGIWLTPAGVPLKKIQMIEENWTVIPDNKACPLNTEVEWKLKNQFEEKICFPSPNKETTPSNNWINQLEPWF